MLLKTGYRRSNGAGRWRSTNIYFGEKLKTYYDGWCIFCTYITSIQFDMETKMKVESQRRRVSWIYVACCGLAYIFRWGNLISYSGWNDEFKWWLLLPGHWLEEHIYALLLFWDSWVVAKYLVLDTGPQLGQGNTPPNKVVCFQGKFPLVKMRERGLFFRLIYIGIWWAAFFKYFALAKVLTG